MISIIIKMSKYTRKQIIENKNRVNNIYNDKHYNKNE